MTKHHDSHHITLQYPCIFPIKVMGRKEFPLLEWSKRVVLKHSPHMTEVNVRVSESREGKYLSITLSISAISQNQMDAIYKELSEHHYTLMVL